MCGRVKALIHEPFRPYCLGGPSDPHVIGPIRLKHTGCHTIQPKLTGFSKGKVDVFNLDATRVFPSLVSSGLLHFSPSGGCSLAGRCSLSGVWNVACCIWSGQVVTDAPSRFNRTVMLTHDPFETRFKWTSSTIQPKRLVCQHTPSIGLRLPSSNHCMPLWLRRRSQTAVVGLP